jgi:hypothetical protein
MNIITRLDAIRTRLLAEIVVAGVIANTFVYFAYNTLTV